MNDNHTNAGQFQPLEALELLDQVIKITCQNNLKSCTSPAAL